jgi:hypothetical protein
MDQNKIFDIYIEIEDVIVELINRGVDDIYINRLRYLRDDIKTIYVNNFVWKAEKSYV